MKLHLRDSGRLIIREKILDSLHQPSGSTPGKRIEINGSERYARQTERIQSLFQPFSIYPLLSEDLERQSIAYPDIQESVQFSANTRRAVILRR